MLCVFHFVESRVFVVPVRLLLYRSAFVIQLKPKNKRCPKSSTCVCNQMHVNRKNLFCDVMSKNAGQTPKPHQTWQPLRRCYRCNPSQVPLCVIQGERTYICMVFSRPPLTNLRKMSSNFPLERTKGHKAQRTDGPRAGKKYRPPGLNE